MQNSVLDNPEREDLEKEDSESQTCESDNAWQMKSVSSDQLKKWELEKERYDEIIEYIKEVDEILNIIKPSPRQSCENVVESQRQTLSRCESQSRYGLDHLENIIKLVEQLKQLKENNSKLSERTCYLKDLRKLREHKRRLKNEELELRSRSRVHSSVTPEEYPEDVTESLLKARKISSTASEKFEDETEGWQHKRKSLCLPPVEGQSKSKVSKWTKVKEAFHWERTSVVLKPNRKELPSLELPEEKVFPGEHSPDLESLNVFDDLSQLPPPPPPPPPPPKRSEDLLSVRPVSDFPSSSSSDRLDDYFSDGRGIKTPDAECGSQVFVDDNEDMEKAIRKSSSGEFPQHLCKEESRLPKSNKTTWGKVKDIIQTRKDSLKKKPKKRASDEFKKRRKLSSSQYSDQFEDLSSPEDKSKAECIPKVGYDFPDDPSSTLLESEEKSTKKLMPALTVTLPSTEELRSLSSDELEKKEVEDGKVSILGQFSCQAQYCEDKTKSGKIKSGQNQRLSRWIKVKRVFLTSATPTRPSYSPGNDSSPTSQNKSSGFFSDMESDDLSSGEWIDDKSPTHEKPRMTELESQSALIQEDIRRSYNELQKKLSQEFDQKLREWEMKSEGMSTLKQDDLASKPKDEADSIPKLRKTRESMAVPLPSINDLSPEFKKKLNDWKKMKTSQSSSSVSSSATREEVQGQNIKIRIGEWQPWRNRSSQKCFSEDFSKKTEEGRPPCNRKKEKDENEIGTGRRDSKRRDSTKKLSHNRSSGGAESLISSTTTDKDGRFVRRTQKMKDYQWVEKELQKIEREKMRLEQEKEKYLEREARLEKMKKTMGTTCPTEEILVRTPAGFFRFKGISQKFTKKLYEWEKARGIAPEASTFALLEESAKTNAPGDFECEGSVPMHRSKSTGSVPELASALLIQSITHHPSSLSLNDMEELKARDEDDLEESISSERIKAESEEPEAVIVDVEDVVEETAVLNDPPTIKPEVPVYSIAHEEAKPLLKTAEGVCVSRQVEEATNKAIITKKDENPQEFEFRKLSFEGLQESNGNRTNQNEKNFFSNDVNVLENNESESKSSSRDSSLLSTVFDQNKEVAEPKEESKSPPFKSENEKTEYVIPIINKSPKTYFDWSPNEEMPRRKSAEDWKTRSNYEKSSLQDALRLRHDPEAIKRKIKEKITLMQRLSMEGSSRNWRNSDLDYYKTKREEKENIEEKKKERIIQIQLEEDVKISPKKHIEEKGSPAPSVNVFVPTTRKIISPVKTTQGSTPLVCSYVIDDVKSEENTEKVSLGEISKNIMSTTNDSLPSTSTQDVKVEGEPEKKRDIGIPPLPHSPKTYKKLSAKEAAPSIRMIIAKYNQKISEHENANEKRNESGSPTIWRSPVFGRRTQEKIDKYTGEVQKSVSLDNMKAITQSFSPTTSQEGELKGILKSCSVGVMKVRQGSEPKVETSILLKENSPSVLRAMKIQKAKEDFLSGRLGGSESSAPSTLERPKLDFQTNKSNIEIAVEKSEQNMTKSVSAETVSSERSPTEEKPGEGRPLQKSSSKFDISSIKSKFRKIRMRKDKEPKMNAVAALCRQSLLIEVPKTPEENPTSSSLSKSCPSSPVMDRNKNEKSNDSKNKKSK